MNKNAKFIRQVTHPVLFRLFSLKDIPMLFLAGLKVKELDEQHAMTTLKLGYLNKNPFRSIYFACQAMAAEASTGVLAMMYVYGAEPRVSMLVTGMKATFSKKATGRVYFTCNDGLAIASAITETQRTGEGVVVSSTSVGKDEQGDIVAEFVFEWSFKRK
ncbi:MAG: DUF4442 domain-containing protein [Bacteroidia bacterium]